MIILVKILYVHDWICLSILRSQFNLILIFFIASLSSLTKSDYAAFPPVFSATVAWGGGGVGGGGVWVIIL